MTTREKIHVFIAALIAGSFTTHLFHTADLLPTIIIGFVALTLGIVFWIKTSLKFPTDPNLLLPPYLMTAALLMFHIAEEYYYDFGTKIAGITSGVWTTEQFLWSLGFLFPIVWIYGAVAIAKRNPFGGFVSCFVSVGMLLGEPTHLLIFPIREAMLHGGGYAYFPGMWTALLPLISGVWGISVILMDSKRQRRQLKTKILMII